MRLLVAPRGLDTVGLSLAATAASVAATLDHHPGGGQQVKKLRLLAVAPWVHAKENGSASPRGLTSLLSGMGRWDANGAVTVFW